MITFKAKQYYAKFYTSHKQAIIGTDLNVFIRIFGDSGESREIKLQYSKIQDFKLKGHDKKFERGQVGFSLIE